ncbi:hypothetical protein MIMGU_mgv1a002447mg [Erythranthe guttata]|uniref:FRIGIDA-like protein n=1 Tax=Erythranthe guttata TaxID=4155 RepID=A0A022S297_ERYGU|nr:hypothetical protein MIMGU_mgv1a002447mg [Erythranthe guttata]
MEKPCGALSERAVVAENLTKYLLEGFSKTDPRRRNPDLARESAAKTTELDYLRESVVKRLRDWEEKAKECGECRDRKRRKFAVPGEEELSSEREEFLSSVKRREGELDAQVASVREHIERLQVAQAQVQDKQRQAGEKLKEIESREQKLAEKEGKVDLIIRTLDKRITAVENKEKEFKFVLESKMREFLLKEKDLNMKREEFDKEVKSAGEKFAEQEKVRCGFVERLDMAEKKLEGMRASIDERLKEIEFRENDKMRELVSKEQQLDVMSKKFVEVAELADEQLTEREGLAIKLLKRLELAQDNVESLKETVHERYKEIGLKEVELNSIRDWVVRKVDELDSEAAQLEEREKRIKIKKDDVLSEKNELRRKKNKIAVEQNDLQIREDELKARQREMDLVQKSNEQRLEELDRREMSLNSVRGFTRNCFKEHLAIKKKLLSERNLVERRARDLELEIQRLKKTARELELKQKGSSDVINAHVRTDANQSADVKLTVKMDGKTLQMFLNDPQKDLESMGDEIYTVLHLSSDPPKLVLDAMVGFYPPHLREEDVEFNVRKTCIILLQQLIRMSPKIQPYVREEAMELAGAWKSKMGASAENPLELLGFLHLLASYNLTSYFDKDEILGFVMKVAQYRQTPDLCRILGFVESITGNIFLSRNLSFFALPTCYMSAFG